MSKRMISPRIEEETYHKMRVHCAKKRMTIEQFVEETLKEKLKEEK